MSIVEIGCFFVLGAAYWLAVDEWPVWRACMTGAAVATLLSVLTEVLVVRPIEKRAK